MKKPEDCVDITEIRKAIDSIDNRIVELVANRSKYVKEIVKFKKDKKAIEAPDRVREVINSKKNLAVKYGASPVLIEKIYKDMIDFFINEELREWKSE
jgi:isochorismate pyruvate lyase